MSKRRRKRTQQRHKRVPWGADDFAETPFGYMARWGQCISMRNVLSSQEHDEMVTAFLSGAPDLRGEQQARRTRLLQILNEADPVNLLARASLTYLHINGGPDPTGSPTPQ